MNPAIYARVSTVDQDCQIQLKAMHALAPALGFPDAVEYIEKLSGKEGTARPQLQRLLEDCRKKKISTVLVWKLDRFGRSTLDTLTNIKTLEGYKVRFLCPTQGIDTDSSSPTTRFLLTILAAVAQLERDFIVERTQGGQTAYRAAYAAGPEAFEEFIKARNRHSKSGKDLPVGRPRVDDRRLPIILMLKEGISYRAIARKLNISEGSVRKIVKELNNK